MTTACVDAHDHGVLELYNNTAERAVRPVTLGRKNYLFMGSEAAVNQPPSPIP